MRRVTDVMDVTGIRVFSVYMKKTVPRENMCKSITSVTSITLMAQVLENAEGGFLGVRDGLAFTCVEIANLTRKNATCPARFNSEVIVEVSSNKPLFAAKRRPRARMRGTMAIQTFFLVIVFTLLLVGYP
jgi:hypothetical protein